jgi:hypothetical protein
MDVQLSIALIGVISALLGSGVGGLTSYLSTRSMRKLEWRLTQIEKEIVKRENLYAEFLGEANKWIVFSFERKVDTLSDMSSLINLESRIRLVSPSLGGIAREIVACVLDHHEKNKKETREYPTLRDSFITECRIVLDGLRDA